MRQCCDRSKLVADRACGIQPIAIVKGDEFSSVGPAFYEKGPVSSVASECVSAINLPANMNEEFSVFSGEFSSANVFEARTFGVAHLISNILLNLLNLRFFQRYFFRRGLGVCARAATRQGGGKNQSKHERSLRRSVVGFKPGFWQPGQVLS